MLEENENNMFVVSLNICLLYSYLPLPALHCTFVAAAAIARPVQEIAGGISNTEFISNSPSPSPTRIPTPSTRLAMVIVNSADINSRVVITRWKCSIPLAVHFH